jgi:hypothetical protein
MPEGVVLEVIDISTLPLLNPELEKGLPKVVQEGLPAEVQGHGHFFGGAPWVWLINA